MKPPIWFNKNVTDKTIVAISKQKETKDSHIFF